jgi:hypothetical protein
MVPAVLAVSPAPAEVKWRPVGSIEMGLDTYAQIYRLTDFVDGSLAGSLRDTTDVFTEARLAAEFGLRSTSERWTSDLRARFSSGTESRRGRAEFDLGYRDTRTRLDLDLEVEGRRFADDTDFTLSSDVGEGRLRMRWQRNVREGLALGVRTRAEAVRYERRSPFELDNQRLDVALTTEVRQGLSQWFDAEVGIGRRSVPDSTAIAYDRAFASAQYHREIDARWRVSFAHFLERRVYDDPRERSAFVDATLEPELRLRLDDRWELRWASSLEWIDYDTGNEVYFDLFLGQTGVALAHRRGWLELAIEPRLNWLRTPASVQDEYGQSSVVLRMDWMGTGRWWFSVSGEVGHRDYREAQDGELDLYSDYWFLRSTVLASLRLTERVSLDGFLSDEPESHRRSADDARLTLVNLNLRWRF